MDVAPPAHSQIFLLGGSMDTLLTDQNGKKSSINFSASGHRIELSWHSFYLGWPRAINNRQNHIILEKRHRIANHRFSGKMLPLHIEDVTFTRTLNSCGVYRWTQLGQELVSSRCCLALVLLVRLTFLQAGVQPNGYADCPGGCL